MAVLDGTQDPADPVVLYVQADHLARPVGLTDAAGSVVWRASYDPFGAVTEIVGPASLDLRFPGQWFQLETGLAYNWHRHYDASTGRYSTPDPLGLHQDPQPRATGSGDVKEDFDAWLHRLGLGAGPAQDDGRRVLRDGTNLYAYAGSDPLQQTDPKGLMSKGPMSPRLDRLLMQYCGIKPELADYCYEKCKHLQSVDHGNEFRGCYRRCTGQDLGVFPW